jgi:hypothetical protein
MPFKSKAQQRFMYANHPEIAKRWEDDYGIAKNLPEHVKKKRKRRKRGTLSKALRG